MKLSGTLITIAVIILVPILLLGYAIIHYYTHQTIRMDKQSKTNSGTVHSKLESDEFASIFDEEDNLNE